MPSIIEEIPSKVIRVVRKSFQFCKRKLQEHNAHVQEEQRRREWNSFLNVTLDSLVDMVKEHVRPDQYAHELKKIYEEQEVTYPDGRSSMQTVHVGDEKIPECLIDERGQGFKMSCTAFSFTIFGEIDPTALTIMRDTWIHYLHRSTLHFSGFADIYKKDGLQRLVFVMGKKADIRNVKRDISKLKYP